MERITADTKLMSPDGLTNSLGLPTHLSVDVLSNLTNPVHMIHLLLLGGTDEEKRLRE